MKRSRDHLQVQQIIDTLTNLTDETLELRRRLRHSRAAGERRGDPEREKRIKQQLAKVRTAMEPVRSEINRSAWYPVAGGLEDKLRHASKRAQRETNQLRKLLVS